MQDFFQQIWKVIVDSNLLNIIGAVAILGIGWLVALWASRKVSQAVQKLASRQGKLPDGTDLPQVSHADTLVGKVVYFGILIFALLGCFSVLGLSEAAEPIQAFIREIMQYAPSIVGALLLAVVAWFVAGLARAVTKAALLKSRLNERLSAQAGVKDSSVMPEYAARTVYYTIFLFFLPAILKTLNIYGITQPLQAMFEKVLTYLPHLLAAAAILVVGLFVAGVIRRAVSGLLVISRLNAFGEKVGVSRMFGNGGLAAMVGLVAYILVAIPVVISALTALQIKVLSDSVAGFFEKLLNATGDVIGAALIVFVAVLLGGFVSSLVAQVVEAFGLDRFFRGMGLYREGEKSTPPSLIVGKLCFVAIVLLAVLSACDILGFAQLANLLRDLAAFGGNLLLGIAVLLVGVWLANFAAGALTGKCNDMLVAGVRVGVIVFTVAMAIGTVNIGGKIVEIAFALILGSVCVAAAVAFGVGGREVAGKLLSDWVAKWKK